MIRSPLCIVIITLLAGCVAGPETLAVQPKPVVTATGVGRGAVVGLSCLDQRPERRGGIPAGSYVIDPNADIAGTLCDSAVDGLRRMGFAPAIGAASSGATLQLEVLRIAHAVGGGTFKRAVEVEAELRATAAASGRQYSTSYRAQRMREVAFTPRRETVQELSDETVSAALSRTLADPAILAILTGAGAAPGGPAPAVNQPDTQTFPYP